MGSPTCAESSAVWKPGTSLLKGEKGCARLENGVSRKKKDYLPKDGGGRSCERGSCRARKVDISRDKSLLNLLHKERYNSEDKGRRCTRLRVAKGKITTRRRKIRVFSADGSNSACGWGESPRMKGSRANQKQRWLLNKKRRGWGT